jgi:acetyl esterase
MQGSADSRKNRMTAIDTGKYAMLADEGIRRFMIESDALYPPDAVNFTMAEQRAFYDKLCAHFRRPRPSGLDVCDLTVAGPGGPVPIRLYRPAVRGPLPVLLYLHGGGYVLGGLDSHDDICAEIANGAGVGVAAVAYRLAPEHRFPAAFEDCRAARAWIVAAGSDHGIDPTRLVIGGDSAGGNLTAALALDARDRGDPALAGQVLIYPGLGGDRRQGSYVEHANAPGLTTADTEYYRSVYIGPPDDPGHTSKLAHPLLETDYRGLPPAFLVAAEWDPLRDDCFVYAERLRAAAVPAAVRHEALLVHAFLRARNMSKPAAESFAAIVAAVRSLAHRGVLPEEKEGD